MEAINAETTLLSADRKHAAVIQKAEVTGGRAEAGQVQEIVQKTIDKMNLSGADYDTQSAVLNRMRIGEMTENLRSTLASRLWKNRSNSEESSDSFQAVGRFPRKTSARQTRRFRFCVT